MSDLKNVRLRAMTVGDFRKSERTNAEEFLKRHPIQLQPDDAILFINSDGSQLLFILGLTEITAESGMKFRVVDSRRWRLLGSSWSAEMLQDYAHSVGLHLRGIRSFREIMDARERQRRGIVENEVKAA